MAFVRSSEIDDAVGLGSEIEFAAKLSGHRSGWPIVDAIHPCDRQPAIIHSTPRPGLLTNQSGHSYRSVLSVL